LLKVRANGTGLEVEFTDALGRGKKQGCRIDDFRPEWDLVFDDDDEGLCEMCERETVLTYHHLVPKETHSHVLKRGIGLNDLGLTQEATTAAIGSSSLQSAEITKEFLGQHGSWLCRPCHSAVHRFADNFELGLKYNTVEKLMAEPRMQVRRTMTAW
jgi:hypothetical protein